MREIKFRVFGKTKLGQPLNKFIYSDEFQDYNENDRRYWYFKYLSDQDIEHDGLQLFTGLKEKNGVDIYDNDIIEVDKVWMDMTCDDRKLGIVKFRGGAFIFSPCESQGDMISFLWPVAKYCTVIGNTYENQELLQNYSNNITE